MSGLDPRTRALFDDAAPFEQPSAEDRARVRAKLARRFGAGVLGGGAATVAASKVAAAGAIAAPASAVGLLGLAGKVVGALLVVGVASGGVAYGVHAYRAHAAPHPEAAPVAPAPAAVAAEPLVPPTPESLEPQDPSIRAADPAGAPSTMPPPARGSGRASAAPGRASASPGASSTSSFAEELALLGDAQRALRGGDPARALDLTDRHAALYPHGQLAEERAGVRVLSLCALGRPEASAQAERFLRVHPKAPLADRVRLACRVP
jgi:hypothetical protein